MELTYDSTLREIRGNHGMLRYHEAGEGPPLLLLHGSGPGVSGWRNFHGNLPVFAEHYRCIVLEFPGFGVSDPTDKHPMAAAPEAVIELLDLLNLEQVDIIGNSMGGMVATRVAIEHPQRVRRMVTVGGAGRNLFSPGPGEGIKLLTEFTDEPSREKLVRWLHSMVYDPAMVTEDLVEQRWAQATDPDTLASAKRMYSSAAMAAMAKAAPSPPLWAMLDQVKAKTLITWGRDDRVSPVDMAILPMRIIPDAEIHIFPNCGHWVMIEQKQAWENAVLAFLLRKDEA